MTRAEQDAAIVADYLAGKSYRDIQLRFGVARWKISYILRKCIPLSERRSSQWKRFERRTGLPARLVKGQPNPDELAAAISTIRAKSFPAPEPVVTRQHWTERLPRPLPRSVVAFVAGLDTPGDERWSGE